MPAENKVKKLGRVEYIEPNSLFVGSPGDKVQNGIPQPYEDYSFSVNLRVINGDRYDCGLTSEGGDIAAKSLEFSSDNGTISFMDGTSVGGQGYLTTNFTDISMNNPETNTKECLGIESISIKYDSWYFPTVDIKFVDVRGASLMQPAEYEYYNNGGPNLGKNKSMSNSDFFKAFFSFPYPLFKLSVKGLYGKEITYDLSVSSCGGIEFNSSTGNFEMSTSFIGYMYGLYADLPFPFIFLAPYIDLYGKNTWDEKISTGDFCYLTTDKENPTGIGMHTFPELRKAIQNAGEQADKLEMQTKEGEKKVELDKLINKLEQSVIFSYPLTAKNHTWWSWSNSKTDTDKSGYFFIAAPNSKEVNRRFFIEFIVFGKGVTEYNELAAKSKYYIGKSINALSPLDELYAEAMSVRDNRKQVGTGASAQTVAVDFTDDEVSKLLDGKVASLVFHKNETDKNNVILEFDSAKSSYGSSDRAKYEALITELKRRFTDAATPSPMKKNFAEKEWVIRAIYVDNIEYKTKVVDVLNSMKKELNELVAKLDKYREYNVLQALGFKPSLKNMFNLVFAHIDTFMATYYNTLDRIRQSIQSSTDNTRNYKSLCGDSIKVDVNQNTLDSDSSNGGKLPPFTMFYREEIEKDSEDRKLKMIWPGSLNGGKELDEVKLVEAIVNATALNRKRYTPVAARHNVANREGNLVPTNYYDLTRESGNPYLDVLNDKSLSDRDIATEVLRVFTLRCYYSMLSGSYLGTPEGAKNDDASSSVSNFTKKAKLIAELEVGNLVRAFQMLGMSPKQNFLEKFMEMSNDGNALISTMTSGDKPMFKSVGGSGNLAYNWITLGGNQCLPVGLFNHSPIKNYLAGVSLGSNYDKFVKLNSGGTMVNGDYACFIYQGGKGVEKKLNKYTSGDYTNAARLFPSYGNIPKSISDLSFEASSGNYSVKTMYEKIGSDKPLESYLPSVPSYRRTAAGTTSIFMDPLYYAQTSPAARAYLFLMGIPYGRDKKFAIPETVENGDYPTLMLLREGAMYWRNSTLTWTRHEGSPFILVDNDPITYDYRIDSNEPRILNALSDIEANDPVFGVRVVTEDFENLAKNVSEGRKIVLMKYFLKWVNGVETDPPASVTAATSVKVNIPSPELSFSEIEKHLALYEMVGTLNVPLTPGDCYYAVTQGNVTFFTNAGMLKSMYNIGPGDNLGSTDGIIRTNVKISLSGNEAGDSKSFKERFKNLYTSFDTVIDFSCLDNPTADFTVPRSAMNDALTAFMASLKDEYGISSSSFKNNTGTGSLGEAEDIYKQPEVFKSDDFKLACYIALKNMYDRWLCSRRRESWYFSCHPDRLKNNGIMSDFRRFFYIDEFYHDIGMQISPNLTNFIENACKLGGFSEGVDKENIAASSIIKLLSQTAQYAGCALLTLPTMLGLARTYTDENNSIADVFKAYPYNEAVRSDNIETTFIALYSNHKSSVLDIADDKGKTAYQTDGFDIANTWGEIVPQTMFSDGGEDGFVVPCFGVTFAKQNQSYFKDVRLSMSDHQVTEFSVRNEVAISYANNRGPRETTIIGQDLYGVFSNYSYSCTVNMLGDAQITPLMYFQLNNIAMWKGAYMITSVRHNITVQGMETEFTGVRQSRYSVPFKNDDLDMILNDITKLTPQDGEEEEVGEQKNVIDVSDGPLDNVNVDNVRSVVMTLDRTSLRTSNKWVNGFLSITVYNNDGTTSRFGDTAQTIEATFGLTDRMGTKEGRIEYNTSVSANTVEFCLPAGRYSSVFVESPLSGEEYRDPNDSFFKFTNGKHLVVSDSRLGYKRCEIITGETNYDRFETGGFREISFGGTSPIMLYPPVDPDMNKQLDKNALRATYREIFNFVKRVNEAKKPITFLINESTDIQKKRT